MSSSRLATVFRQGKAVATNTGKMGRTLPPTSKNRNVERRNAERRNAAVTMKDKDANSITEKFGRVLKMFAPGTMKNTDATSSQGNKALEASATINKRAPSAIKYSRPLPEGSKRWFQWCAADLKRHMEKMEVKPTEHTFTWSTEKLEKEGESFFCDGKKFQIRKNEDMKKLYQKFLDEKKDEKPLDLVFKYQMLVSAKVILILTLGVCLGLQTRDIVKHVNFRRQIGQCMSGYFLHPIRLRN